MNGLAVAIGLFYGCFSAALFYAISMLTSGLFARPSYRLYARVLIGICCVMLAAPGLRWLASSAPVWGIAGLRAAQYLAVGVLMVGVLSFNRKILPRLLAKRSTTVYFVLGTWANAAVVSLVFLQFAVSGGATWETLSGRHAYFTIGHYGPLLMLVSAMVFHTDYRLKVCKREPIHFSRFSFIGYAIAFLGIAISLLPFAGQAITELSLSTTQWSVLQSSSCGQALLIAILLFGWLVWRYETIPPLFALLAVIVAEYHVLVVQWVMRWMGPESWALSCLPLLVGLNALDIYFSKWEARKDKSRPGNASAHAAELAVDGGQLRFALPFRVVYLMMGLVVFCLPLWFRSLSAQTGAWWWLGVTYVAYAVFCVWQAWSRQQPKWLYASGGLAALAAVFGFSSAGQPLSALILGGLALVWAGLAVVADRLYWNRWCRTAMTDCAMLTAGVAWVLVFSRHLWGDSPYLFQMVGVADSLALVMSTLTLLACAYEYRSCLPVYLALTALATIAPIQSASIGLLAIFLATGMGHLLPAESNYEFDHRLRFLNRFGLPFVKKRSELFLSAFSKGVIPFGLAGLAFAMMRFWRGDLSIGVVFGLAASSLTLGLATRTQRIVWLYLTAILAGYLTIHVAAFRLNWGNGSASQTLTAHLCLAIGVSLLGFVVARVVGWWSQQLLMRVAEEKETYVRERGEFYSGYLQQFTLVVSLGGLVGLGWAVLTHQPGTLNLMLLSVLLGVFFGLVAATYRTQVATYLSLASLSFGLPLVAEFTSWSWLSVPLLFASGSLLATLIANSLGNRAASATGRKARITLWDAKPPVFLNALPAEGVWLWRQPLAIYAVLSGILAIILMPLDAGVIRDSDSAWWATYPIAISTLLVSLSLLLSTRVLRMPLIYLAGLSLCLLGIDTLFQIRSFGEGSRATSADLHLIVAAVAGIATTVLGIIWSAYFHRRMNSASESRLEQLRAGCTFYAGYLQHFAFAVMLGASGMLLALSIGGATADIANRALSAVCVLLATGYAIQGSVYRSRLHSYFALTAAVMGIVWGLAGWETRLPSEWTSVLLMSSVAIGFGVLSCLVRRSNPVTGQTAWDAAWPISKPWLEPPLPGLAIGWSLWAKPLADVSSVLAVIALTRAVLMTDASELGLLAWALGAFSVAFLLGTFSYRPGIIPVLAGVSSEPAEVRFRWEQVERQLFYALALTGFACTLHLLGQILFWSGLKFADAIPWHLALAASLSLGLWALSVLVASGYRRIATSEVQPSTQRVQQLQAAAATYVAMPQLVAGLLAGSLLILVCGWVFLADGIPRALAVTPLILAVAFGLLGGNYQTRLATYLSLLASTLFVLLASYRWLHSEWPLLVWTPAVLASCSLLMMVISQVMERAASASADTTSQPAAWIALPPPLSVWNWSELWMAPARQSSMFYLSVALGAGLVSFFMESSTDAHSLFLVAACLPGIVSLFLATSAFQSSLPMYLACGLLASAIFPASRLFEQPVTKMSVTWAVLGASFWGFSFVLERVVASVRRLDTSKLPWLELYQTPLIRSAAVLSTLSIFGSLSAYVLPTYIVTPGAVFLTCSLGATTLLLCARSARMVHRTTLAHGLVYLACVAFLGGISVIVFARWGEAAIGLAWACTALGMSLVGAGLLNFGRSQEALRQSAEDWRRIFGEPLGFAALAFSAAGVALNLALLASGIGESSQQTAQLHLSASMVLSCLTFAIGAKAFRQPIFLHVAVVLGSCGAAIVVALPFGWPSPITLLILLLLMHGLLLGARLVHGAPGRAQSLLGVDANAAELAFYVWAMLGASMLFIWQSVQLVAWFQGVSFGTQAYLWPLATLLTCGFYYLACYQSSTNYPLQLLIVSTLLAVGWGGVEFGGSLLPVDVWLVLLGLGWGAGGLWMKHRTERGDEVKVPLLPAITEVSPWMTAMSAWSLLIVLASIMLSFPVDKMWDPVWPSTALTVFLAALGFSVGGWQWKDLSASTLALLLFPFGPIYVAYFYGSPNTLVALAALILVLVSCLYSALAWRLIRGSNQSTDFNQAMDKRLGIVEEGLVALAFVGGLYGMVQLGAGLLSVATMLLISGVWFTRGFQTARERYIYAGVAALATGVVILVYGYLGIPLQPHPVLAFSVLAISLALFATNIVVSRNTPPSLQVLVRPTYYLAILSPILLLVSIPFGRPDVAALSMLACGAYYLFVSYHVRHNWSLYVAIICFNVAAYIWLPVIQASTGLLQLYIHPAAISVLIFAHLHRRELKPSVLNGIRYMASGVILATATLEVFASSQASLVHFVVVLALSLLGIAAGVAFRVRPFIFIGVSFLILNVIGQVGLQFHREGGIIRAVILIGVGVLVLGAMIFFNVHRERILHQYRRFLSDPEWQ